MINSQDNLKLSQAFMTHPSLEILFVTPYLPASTRLRPNGFLRELSKRHRITSVCLVHPSWEGKFLTELDAYCDSVFPFYQNRYIGLFQAILSLFSQKPVTVGYCSMQRINKKIIELLDKRKFDIVHTEFVRAAQYTQDIKGVPKVYDAVDSLALAYRRSLDHPGAGVQNKIVALEEWIKLRTYENEVTRNFDRVIVCSPVDREYLLQTNVPRIDVIPHGVDLEYYAWADQERDENELIFVGKMNYYPNVDSILYFVEDIFPLIKAKRPQTRLKIVGWNPTKSIRNLVKDPAVCVTGGVSDLRPYLTRASVFICPLLSGSGLQFKVLQTMAVGTPVVTTSIVARALYAEDGKHLLIADKADDFAEAVLLLMREKRLQRSLSVNGRQWVEHNHNWSRIAQKLEHIYFDLLDA